VRWVTVRDVSQAQPIRTYNEYRACAPRWPGVGPSLPTHIRRPSGVYIYVPSSAPNFEHAQKSRRTKRMATNENRWSSALDERVTNDDELGTTHFSVLLVRSSCVHPVWPGFKRKGAGNSRQFICAWCKVTLNRTMYLNPIQQPATVYKRHILREYNKLLESDWNELLSPLQWDAVLPTIPGQATAFYIVR